MKKYRKAHVQIQLNKRNARQRQKHSVDGVECCWRGLAEPDKGLGPLEVCILFFEQ